jgi:glutathione S-transferase
MSKVVGTARLITIPFSHFCEKVRWGADWLGVPYREDAYLPLVHAIPAWRASGKRSVPVWITPEGEAISDSTKILARLDTREPVGHGLYPSDPADRLEAEALEELFDTKLGPSSRGWAYDHLLRDGRNLVAVCGATMGALERATFRALAPLLSVVIRRGYRVGLGSADAFLARARAVFDTVSARLEGGRSFLVGNRFSVADLTFASLATPLLLPRENPQVSSDVAILPPAIASVIHEMRETPAGRFGLRMYREHRHSTRLA